jgi:Ca2+-transporting ATPase
VVEAIHTAVPGRARFKVNELYHSETLKRALKSRLAATPGVFSVSASALTGTVLVSFNSSNTPASIATVIENLLGDFAQHGPTPAVQVSTNGAYTLAAPLSTHTSGEGPDATSRIQQTLLAAPNMPAQALDRAIDTRPGPAWHVLEADAAVAAWHSSHTHGLSSADVEKQQRLHGPNILPEAESRSAWEMLLDQVNSLPVALLTAAAGISLVTGGLADALVIMGVVAINATIGYLTESHSENTIHSLKTLVRPATLVVRDRQIHEIPASEVVPGDILVLKPGSYVAADCRLLEVERLTVDESALTGESLPVRKTAAPLSNVDLPLGDRINMVYMGTLVTGGQGLAVVVATGRLTELGQIQLLAGEAQAPNTPLERQLDHMGAQLVLIGGGICGLVFGVGLLRGYGFLEMLKMAISLAVAAVPEGLPTIATTTLALGIVNMRKHHVLIRRLEAVEALGCVQAICLDKTGTLTLNRMSVVAAYTGRQRITITDGRFLAEEQCIDPLTCEEFIRLAQVCVLCSEAEIERNNGQYVLKGSPTENALIHLAISAGLDVLALRAEYPIQTMRLRADNRNFMSTLHRPTQVKQNGDAPLLLLAVKGSPGEVLSRCTWREQDGVRRPLTDEDRLRIETENERMAGAALRVLGCAYGYVEGEREDGDLLEELTWVGLVGMADPVRAGVKTVIDGFHRAGIDTIMITGDQSPTAYAIGKELALSPNGQVEILDSTHLANIDPEIMKGLAGTVHVFARVSPAHKLQIVQALQRSGKVVAMTGDGVNDGPALKAANIGVAMGHAGTDVAREVADVVLENDDLETMLIGISQGRTIYNNIRKSVHFLLSTNLSEIIVTATAISAGLGQPLNAMQLLWINLLPDIFPGLALALEPSEPDIMSQPPRNPDEPIIKTSDFRSIAVESTTLSAGALGAYGYGLLRYGAGAQASTIAFTTLTAGQLLHAITSRSETHSVFDATPLASNPYLSAALLGSFGLQALILSVPGLRSLLGLTPLSALDGLVIGGSALLPFLVNEATKKLRALQPASWPVDTR